VLDHVEHWAKANNLKLNRAKSREVFLAPLKSLTFWRYTNQIIIIIIIIRVLRCRGINDQALQAVYRSVVV